MKPDMASDLRRVAFSTALLFPVLLTACASFETKESKLKPIKSLSIISAVGDDFNLTQAGMTGLNSSSRHYAIGSWGLDEAIINKISAALSRRYRIEPLNYQQTAFSAKRKKSPFALINLMSEDSMTALMRAQMSAGAVDAYIVVMKAESPVGSGNGAVSGIGAVSYAAVFGSYHLVHALYEIDVIDGHTFDVIERRRATPLEKVESARLAGPSHAVDEADMPLSGDATPNAKLREVVTELIERSLPSALRDLQLADQH